MNCGCDEQMAFTLTEQFASGVYNEDFLTRADGSGWDHADCRAPTPNPDNGNGGGGNGGEDGPVVEELQCCGTYPNRFEFLTHGGSRSCCGEVTYNTNKHDCCAGGFLGAIGRC